MTTNILLFLKGLIIGLAMASPFGPIGLVFIQRSLENEKFEGVASGFGIASGDMIYAIIMTFGFTLLQDYIVGHLLYMKIIAAVVLIVIAVRTLRIKIELTTENEHKRNLFKAFGKSFLIAIHNPSTIIVFAFLFALLNVDDILSKTNAVFLILGIFSGSSALWFTINQIIHFFKKREKLLYITFFYRLSGFLLLIISLIIIISLTNIFHLG